MLRKFRVENSDVLIVARELVANFRKFRVENSDVLIFISLVFKKFRVENSDFLVVFGSITTQLEGWELDFLFVGIIAVRFSNLARVVSSLT